MQPRPSSESTDRPPESPPPAGDCSYTTVVYSWNGQDPRSPATGLPRALVALVAFIASSFTLGGCGLLLDADPPAGRDSSTPAACRSNAQCGPCAICDNGLCLPAAGLPCVAPGRCAAGTYSCVEGRVRCSANEVAPAGTVCRRGDGECDPEEVCDGLTLGCAPDVHAPPDAPCDVGEGSCNGDGLCVYAECREGAPCDDVGPCEVGRLSCDGPVPVCVAMGFQPADHVCQPALGVCDTEELCPGDGPECPADAMAAVGTVCRPGDEASCDATETCDGFSERCPRDAPASASTPCGDDLWCDGEGTCGACPAGGACVVPGTCEAGTWACPAAGPECVGTGMAAPEMTPCGAAPTGGCDAADLCSGMSLRCDDAFLPMGTTCRASGGFCDVAETCSGSSPTCPGNAFASSGLVCRPTAGGCDAPEYCTGSGAACPMADAFVPGGTVCRASGGACDPAGLCAGSAPTCPSRTGSTAVCRSAAGPCDAPETCTLSSDECPADSNVAAGTLCPGGVCTADGACIPEGCVAGDPCMVGPCQAGEWECTSGASVCRPVGDALTGICRPAAGPCDVPESCNGSSAACPPDSFHGPSFVCRSAVGLCDQTEMCTGTSAACPLDQLEPAGGLCRPPAGLCDIPDTCDGSAPECPDAREPMGFACRPADDVCDVRELCSGTNTNCPPDAFRPGTAYCTTPGTICAPGKLCTGADPACPAPAPPVGADGALCSPCGSTCMAGECRPEMGPGGACMVAGDMCCPHSPDGTGGGCMSFCTVGAGI